MSLLELSRNPEQFYGRSVTVSGTVARVFEPGVFTMVTNEVEENEEPTEDEAVIVLNNDGSGVQLQEEAVIQVTGEVMRLATQLDGSALSARIFDVGYGRF